MTKRVLGIFILLGLFALPPLGLAATSRQCGEGKVVFLAIGRPGFLRINGEGQGLECSIMLTGPDNLQEAKIVFELKNLKTGLNLRDRHMRDQYLEVAQFPVATLAVKQTALIGYAPKEDTLVGDLTLHGVTKPIQVKTKVNPRGSQFEIESTFEIALTDYGIDIPSFAGVTVADKVDVTVTFVTEESK